ncbi:transmembrane protein, partial [mine drainage metagenome]
VTVLLSFAFVHQLLHLLGYPQSYARIFQFDVIGVSLQLLMMSMLNVYQYLDLRGRGVLLSGVFLIGNVVLTYLSLRAGPFFYGLGFLSALFVSDLIGLALLTSDLERIDFTTFVRAR